MAKMWRFFRESGPKREDVPEDLYTMEIHHGGYFDKMPDGTKKYKVARFNKDGGKIWLDGLDPDKIAWTEFGNIAWDLGYREKPISYYYKMPRTYCNEGWMPLRNDADALEMVKLIPLKTRQISVFITGGGRRRKKEAEEDDLRPVDPNWENPLNRLTAAEKRNVELEANIAGSKLNRLGVSGCGSSGVNVVGGGDVNARQEGVRQKVRADGVINLDSDSDLEATEGGRQQSQGTFTGLSDLVPDLFAFESVAQAGNDNIGQGQRNKAEEQAEVGYNKHIPRPRPRVKHTVQKRWEGRRLPCVLAAEQQESEPTEVEAVEPTQTEPGHPKAEASQFEAQLSQVEGEASQVEPSQPEVKEAESEAEAEAEASQFEAQPSQVEGEASKVEPTEAEAKEAEVEAKEAEAEASQFEAQPSQVEGEASKVEPTEAEAKEAEVEAKEAEAERLSQFEAPPSQVEGEPSQAEAKEAEVEAKEAEAERLSQFEAPPSQVEGEPSQAEAKEAESGEKKGKKQNQGEKGKKQNKGVGKGKKVGESEKGKKVGESERVKKQKLSEAEKGKKVAVDSGRPASKKKGRQTKEPRYNTRKSSSKVYEQVEDTDTSSEGSDFYIDSDYDPQDSEDDVEFEAIVSNPTIVEEYEDMGFRGQCSDEGGDTEEDLGSLQGSETEEDEEGNPLPMPTWRGIKLKSWNRRVDLKNPKFVLGHVFPNNEVLKEAIRECGLVSRRGLWFQKNSKQKIEVKCQLGCPFWLYASNIADLGPSTLVIKTLNDKHNCSHLTHSHHLTYNRVAKEVQADLLVDEDWSRKGIQNHIQKKFNLDVSVQKISRGKIKAKRMNEGHYIDQYNKLASYRKELMMSNPGSTVEIKTEMVGEVRRFHRMYVCLAACKKGWIEGCRPIIGLDGCHIKGHHPGQLLCAVGVDANNGMFPIAYAIAEVENTDTWRWFLEYLKWDLRIERESAYTFITDKQKGLGIAIGELFPEAEHRHCVRHMYNNFKAKHPGEGLKQLVWDAARSSTKVWFKKHMEELQQLDDVAWKWFEDKNPEQWSRAYFREDSKCDLLLNNLCESWNAALIPARDKPILTMLEKIRMELMVRMANRRVAAHRWKDMVGPRIKKIIEKVAERTSCYRAYHSGEFEFQITGGEDHGSKHAVDLRMHTCTCRRWQLSGIPCVHAICAIRTKKADPVLFCDDYLLPFTYMESYNPIIHPIAGEDDWEPVDYPIAPPPYKKQAGRPKMKRTKEPGENKQPPPAPNTTKMPRTYSKMTCQVCFKKGHNRLGCPIRKAKKAAAQQAGEGSSNAPKQNKKRSRQQAAKVPTSKGRPILNDNIIKSRKGWKKMKTMDGSQGADARPSSSQTMHDPPTQGSQNPAAKKARQQGQTDSEWAGL